MKKLLLILLCLPLFTLAQQTYVPDNNFEAYLENNGMGNGILNDDYVTTANINTVISLGVAYESIADLTGIEDFTSLTFLGCNDNQLTSLDVSNNILLNTLWCSWNQLTTLDVSQNTNLTSLWCYDNQLTSLDVSNNTFLDILSCENNNLINLDIRNGNNIIITKFRCYNNPIFSCINVDDSLYSTNNWLDTSLAPNFSFDPQHYFSNNCPSTTDLQEHTTNKELLKVTDLLGRETKGTKDEILFYIYDDGTVEKRIVIE